MMRSVDMTSLRMPARRAVEVSWTARYVLPLAERLLAALETYRQRRALLALDDRLLRDIGLSRADAEHEAARSFWDVPGRWP
jgi:uncharacterized protein YjiS (DUF1127 family)